MQEELFGRYIARRKQLGDFAAFAPYDWKALIGTLPISWMAYSQFLEEHAGELANVINEFRNLLGQLIAWRDVLPELSQEDQHRAVIDFINAPATLALLMPYVIRSRMIYSIAHLSHQANQLKQDDWKDDLPINEEIWLNVADRYAKPWRSYKRLKQALEKIYDRAYQETTGDFRNGYMHRYSRRIEIGLTGLVHREVRENGRIRYGFGQLEPLKLQDIVPMLTEQHTRCLKAFERYQVLVHEQTEAINAHCASLALTSTAPTSTSNHSTSKLPRKRPQQDSEPDVTVYGIDFTSAPSRKKPITCLNCILSGTELTAGQLEEWTSFEEFETALKQTGPWIAGMDFPFGQARRFIETIGWPQDWSGYVDHIANMSREEFRETMNAYRDSRPVGDKEHRRETDKRANSLSPQKVSFTPVGLMFFEGAPRLRRSGATIPGLQDGDPERIVVEAYPGVLARTLIGKRPYKHDTKAKQTPEQHRARRDIFEALTSNTMETTHGITVKAAPGLADDPGADHLDALLCAVQAAWAWTKRRENYGAPEDFDRLEGWIADPSL